jgi:hypothetical protein
MNTILDHVNPWETVPVGDLQQLLLLRHDTDHDGNYGIERYHVRYLLQSVLKSKIKTSDGSNFKVISIKATSGHIQKHLIATWNGIASLLQQHSLTVMKIILPVKRSETSNLLSYRLLRNAQADRKDRIIG